MDLSWGDGKGASDKLFNEEAVSSSPRGNSPAIAIAPLHLDGYLCSIQCLIEWARRKSGKVPIKSIVGFPINCLEVRPFFVGTWREKKFISFLAQPPTPDKESWSLVAGNHME